MPVPRSRWQHGDPFVSGFANKLLAAVCMPLFGMIRRCVLLMRSQASVQTLEALSWLLLQILLLLLLTPPPVTGCRWVFEGVLEDPHKEFFVRAAPWVVGAAAASRGTSALQLQGGIWLMCGMRCRLGWVGCGKVCGVVVAVGGQPQR
jgi:hypothetical protein